MSSRPGQERGREEDLAEVRGLAPDAYFLLFSPSLYMYLIAGL